jgi:hypothetical protein
MDDYLKDFLDADHPSLSYQKMKQKTQGTFVADDDWHATWHTNAPFKKVKSEFAFHLHDALSTMPDEAARRFTVPRYIREAIEYVTGSAAADPSTAVSSCA